MLQASEVRRRHNSAAGASDIILKSRVLNFQMSMFTDTSH